MTKVIQQGDKRIVIIEPEKDYRCELCDKVAETRPYGPSGEEVCFQCGMKDEEAATKRFYDILMGNIPHA